MPAPTTPPPADADSTFHGPGLLRWVLEISRADVMWLRYVLEASEGMAFLSGGADGVVALIAPESQAAQVRALLGDLCAEMPLRVVEAPGGAFQTRSDSLDQAAE